MKWKSITGKLLELLFKCTKKYVPIEFIRDSSDSNPHFFDLMLAGGSQNTLYSENMEFHGSTSWNRWFSYPLCHK